MFPFIREHLSSLTGKGGLTPLFLPPVVFAEASKPQ
jgi:preprotein translocase subunit SecB